MRGESALYPMHFRHAARDEKQTACRVENANNILYNDTRFAAMGYEDGIEQFNNIELSKQQSVIKVFFA